MRFLNLGLECLGVNSRSQYYELLDTLDFETINKHLQSLSRLNIDCLRFYKNVPN